MGSGGVVTVSAAAAGHAADAVDAGAAALGPGRAGRLGGRRAESTAVRRRRTALIVGPAIAVYII